MKINGFAEIRLLPETHGDFQFIQMNQFLADILGIRFNEIEHTSYKQIQGNFQLLDYFVSVLMSNIQKENFQFYFTLKDDLFYACVSFVEERLAHILVKNQFSSLSGISNDLTPEEKNTIFQILTENIDDVIWLMNKKLETKYMSPAVLTQLGYTPEEYISLPLEIRLPPDSYQKILSVFSEEYEKAMTNPEINSYTMQLQHRHKDGRLIWGEVHVNFIRNNQNEIISILGITRNIENRKKIEDQLLLEKERYSAIVNAYDGMLYICSSDFEIEYMNQKLIERTGYDGTGMKCYEVLHGLNEICDWCVNERIINGETVKWEIQSPKDNRWYKVSNSPIFKPDGTISKQAMIEDITDSKLAEIALSESENQFRMLSENSPMAVFIYQGDKFRYVNPSLVRLTKYTVEELLSMNFYDLVHPDFKELVMSRGLQRQKGIDLLRRYEFKITDKEKNEVWVDFYGTFIEFEGKGAALGTAYDITERKLTEIALSESKERFSSLIDLAVDGIVIGDINGKITNVNLRFLEIIKKDMQNVIGKHVSQLFDKEELDKEPMRFDLLDKGHTVFRERKIIRDDGKAIFVEMHSKRMPDGTYQAFFRDVTERKQANLLLMEQKRFLETLIGNLPGIVYRCKNDPDWTMEFISGRCRELTGYDPDDFIMNRKITFNSIIRSDYQPQVWDKWQYILNKKATFADEYIIVTSEGKEKWVFEKGAGVYDENNQLLALEGFIMDITDRKRIEDLLVKSQFNYKMLAGYNQLLSRAALIFAIAEDIEELEVMILNYYQKLTGSVLTMIMEYNDQKRELQLKQYVSDEEIRLMIFSIFGERAFQQNIQITDAIEKQMTTQGVIKTNKIEDISFGSFDPELLSKLELQAGLTEIVISTIQRKSKLIGTISAFLTDKSNVPDEILKTFSQLAGFALSRKKSEIDLIEAKEKAEMSDKMKSIFLANISHEVKTPMNAILGFTELLEKPHIETQERLKYTKIITRAGTQLLAIIDDLIDLAKIETGQMKIIFNKFDVIQLLNSLYEMMVLKFESKGLRFSLDSSDNITEFFIESDSLRLKQIIINLLDNAFKYTISGEVVFGFNVKDKNIRFYVRDTGIGISPEDSTRIFERFVKLEDGHSGLFAGKGLGLSISKSLAEMLGGQIHLESAVLKGSVFYLTIPVLHK